PDRAPGGHLSGANFGKTFARGRQVRAVPDARPLAPPHGRDSGGVDRRVDQGAHASHRALSPHAALGYQHAVSSRDAEIARALDALTARPSASVSSVFVNSDTEALRRHSWPPSG